MKGVLRLWLLANLVFICLAKRSYVSLLPNGDKISYHGVLWPGSGHPDAQGTNSRTNCFGSDFPSVKKWTVAYCLKDSDGDGQTNGQELGDPCCTWTSGTTPNRTTDISHPAFADSKTSAPPCPYQVPYVADPSVLPLTLTALGASLVILFSIVACGCMARCTASSTSAPSGLNALVFQSKAMSHPSCGDIFGIFSFISDLSVGEFLSLLIYFCTIIIYLGMAKKDYDEGEETATFAKTLGFLSNLHLGLVWIPVTRNSFLFLFIGIPFERAIKYHRLFARVLFCIVAAHFVLEGLKIADEGDIMSLFEFDMSVQPNVAAGFIAFVFMVAISLSSLNFIRRKFWEFFERSHMILFALVTAFSVIHVLSILAYVLPGIVLYVIDLIFRLRSRSVKYKISKWTSFGTTTRLVICNATSNECIQFKPGQYFSVCVPLISRTENHFFSVSSSPGLELAAPAISIHVKGMGEGSFTHALGQKDYTGAEIILEGPYGHPSVDYDLYRHVVFVAGGIGITPLLSMFTYLSEWHTTKKNINQRVTLIWCTRDLELLEAFSSALLGPSSLPSFQVAVFVTGDKIELRERSVSTLPPSIVRFGRPDLLQIFTQIKLDSTRLLAAKRACVLACGPDSLVKTARMTRDIVSDPSFTIDFHHEEFAL